MGKEIDHHQFSQHEFDEFHQKLRQETKILTGWFQNKVFDHQNLRCGYELEAWLTDENLLPSPHNTSFINRLGSSLVVPELSKFNFEINGTPQNLEGKTLSLLQNELSEIWKKGTDLANSYNGHIAAIGILPTIRDQMLTLEYMSERERYYALNTEILRLRDNKPLDVKISKKDDLHIIHQDVMLEAATTSLQIHLQINPFQAKRFYNASLILSAPMVALSANSPYFFGKSLWDETRIPLFEQGVSVASFRDHYGNKIGRVTFGTGYVRESILELFLENLDGYPILLPLTLDEDAAWLNHLRLHNGTIWRWTRPLIGLNQNGKPHIRLEHRVAASGPSICDMIAHIAFFTGCLFEMAQEEIPPETLLSFEDAKKNFYKAARDGLDTNLPWVNGKTYPVKRLFQDILLPKAHRGLQKLGFDDGDIKIYLDEILKPRIASGQNGTTWQRKFMAQNNHNFQALTQAYIENQNTGAPVHEWRV